MCAFEPSGDRGLDVGLRAFYRAGLQVAERLGEQVMIGRRFVPATQIQHIHRLDRESERLTLHGAPQGFQAAMRRIALQQHGFGNLAPSVGRVRDDGGARRLRQIHGHLEIRH
ncbi:hypothetical protein D3C77_258420 [compost metagenome]